jgi:large subunit ribosomal protein L6
MTSRIGKVPLTVPAGVEVKLDGQAIAVKGAKGALDWVIPTGITVKQDADVITVTADDELRETSALHGLSRSLVQNMLLGVSEGWSKTLSIVGTGYRALQKGQGIEIQVGYSHPVLIDPIDEIELKVVDQNTITVSGIDKQKVGEVAANIRKVRKPEPYKGKGIRYADEVVRLKAGKAGK